MMSTEPLSFGPEWLRNRSQEGCSQSSIPIPRYQLAEHRYGREEMLALSVRLNPPPDSIKSIPSLYVERAQVPLALIQMTEDETRQWNRGINSDTVLRLTSKAPVIGPPANIRGGGRGGSVDRGRGRGRGGYYSRGLSFEEAGEGGEVRGGPRPERGDGPSLSASSFPRNIRPFDRSQSTISAERGWSERNGTDPGDWNGSHSPRKEFGTGRSFMNDNWRRHRTGMEDEDGWRTATGGRTEKWTRSNWREGEKEGGDVDRGGRSQQWEQRARGGWDDGHHPQRRPWDEDNLPEWATENPSESGGSFDATGAFHGGGFSDEDEINGGTGSIRRDPRLRKMSEGSGGANIQKRPQTNSSKKSGVDADSDSRKRFSEDVSRQVHNQNVERLASETATPTLNSSSVRDPPTNKQLPSSSDGPAASEAPSVHGHDRTNASAVKQSGSNTTSGSNFVKSSVVDARVESGSALCDEQPHVPHDTAKVSVLKQTVVSTAQSTSTTLPYRGFPPSANTPVSQKPEEAWDQMPEDADHLVEKLMAEDDHQEKLKLSQKPSAVETPQPPPLQRAQEKWYYRDPQGQEQGPFYSSDMAEWYKSGYFKPTLLIRRSCDEHFSHLGDLIESWGMVPFVAPPHFKPSEPIAGLPTTAQTAKSVPTLSSPIDPDPVRLEQYHFQMLQRQLMLSQQVAIQAAVNKLSQNDRWNTHSAIEQQQLIIQQVMSQPLDPYMNMLPGGLDQKNSISQLLSQLQQSKMVTPPMENKLPVPMVPAPPQIPPLDPLQQMIQQMGGLQQPATSPIIPQAMPIPAVPAPPPVSLGLPTMLHPTPTLPEDPAVKTAPDPIQMLLRQLNASKPPVESLWSGSAHPLFGNNLSWMPRVSPPPGQMPTSIWDMQGKEIKTEQEIMEEQRRAAEERRLEELRKQEEECKQKEEEQARLKLEEEVQKEMERRKEEQRKRAEEEKHQQEKEARRKEEEKKKKQQEEEKKRLQEEERKRKEEVKRFEEEARKQKEEAARRKEEEKKRKEEEKEKKKKLEEERRKLEEQRKKEEEEKKRQEEEEMARRKAEEEQARQQRRQAEALRRLQEQQQQRAKAAAWSQPVAPQPSLAEIQRQERDKKEREAKEMQQIVAAQQTAAAAAAVQQAAADKSALHLNWVGKRPAVSKVKSLAEIQAEEHEKIVKNQERERAERAQQQRDVPLPAMSSIWGSASQSLSWAQNNASVWSSASSVSGSGGNTAGNGGFWDDISLNVAKTSAAPTTKNPSNKPTKTGITTSKTSGGNKAKGSKKDEAVVMKLFEQNVQRTDDFTQWCTKTLTELHASCVEIPTFVAFLRDIESPYEVKDYIRTYLGEGKEIIEFSRQFLERRSKWRSMQRAVEDEDDMCSPAPAINPLSTDFTEVKGKGKKTKKNKMFRVDNRILGFNVTAAEDRFNVGDRHYVEEL